MKRILTIILLSHALIVGGCASFGPKLVIETPEPAEDFVVVCQWYKSGILSPFKSGHGTDRYRSDYKVKVAASDEEIDCGMSIYGGDGTFRIMHPVWTGDGTKNYDKDGIKHIVFNKTRLDKLNELKKKFESGGFDHYRWPASKYADSVKGSCWFPHQYFSYYKEAKDVEMEHFKERYYDVLLKCHEIMLPILKQNDKSYSNVTNAEEYVKGYWDPMKWTQFNE